MFDQRLIVMVIGLVVFHVTLRWVCHVHRVTFPGLIVLILAGIARWFTNLAVQGDQFLAGWREYKRANPIQLHSRLHGPRKFTVWTADTKAVSE